LTEGHGIGYLMTYLAGTLHMFIAAPETLNGIFW